jgi:hypothetical protein
MLAFLVVTAGFGVQYLLWPAALLMIGGGWRAWLYPTLAAGYAVFYYLVFLPGPTIAGDRRLVHGSVAVIAAALLALPWERLRPATGPAVPSVRPSRQLVPAFAERGVADRHALAAMAKLNDSFARDGSGSPVPGYSDGHPPALDALLPTMRQC